MDMVSQILSVLADKVIRSPEQIRLNSLGFGHISQHILNELMMQFVKGVRVQDEYELNMHENEKLRWASDSISFPLTIDMVIKIFDVISEAGADINYHDRQGSDILSSAIRSGQIALVKRALDGGANLSVHGSLYLCYAILWNYRHIFKLLVERGVHVPAHSDGCMVHAIMYCAKHDDSCDWLPLLKTYGVDFRRSIESNFAGEFFHKVNESWDFVFRAIANSGLLTFSLRKKTTLDWHFPDVSLGYFTDMAGTKFLVRHGLPVPSAEAFQEAVQSGNYISACNMYLELVNVGKNVELPCHIILGKHHQWYSLTFLAYGAYVFGEMIRRNRSRTSFCKELLPDLDCIANNGTLTKIVAVDYNVPKLRHMVTDRIRGLIIKDGKDLTETLSVLTNGNSSLISYISMSDLICRWKKDMVFLIPA